VPDRDGALGAVFARRRGVDLRFSAPGRAPPGTDVFDYVLPAGDTLFSVVPVPLNQGDAKVAALGDTARRTGVALAVLLACLLLAAPPGRGRWFVLVIGTWAIARGALGVTLDPPRFFSSATFYRGALGPWGASAGSLAALGVLAAVAAVALWRRGLARRAWSIATAGALVLAAPYLVRYFGRGIAPPAGGVSVALWLSWELALALAGMGLVMLAAALVRGEREPDRTPWTLPFALRITIVRRATSAPSRRTATVPIDAAASSASVTPCPGSEAEPCGAAADLTT
jgi:hypothetical protein